MCALCSELTFLALYGIILTPFIKLLRAMQKKEWKRIFLSARAFQWSCLRDFICTLDTVHEPSVKRSYKILMKIFSPSFHTLIEAYKGIFSLRNTTLLDFNNTPRDRTQVDSEQGMIKIVLRGESFSPSLILLDISFDSYPFT